MYPSVEARSEGIEEGARQSAAELRGEALAASERLQATAAAMPDAAWDGEIRTALGRQTTGAEVPWMRIRESWVHAVDLDAGAPVADFPTQVVVDLLDEVTGFVTARGRVPGSILEATDTRAAVAHRSRVATPRCSKGRAVRVARLAHRPQSGRALDSSAGQVPAAPRWL